MSEPEPAESVKEQAAELSALVGAFERRKLTIVEVVMRAYSIGHTQACAGWTRSNETIAKALGVKP